MVLDLHRHKRVAKNMKAESRRVNEGAASIIDGGHEPGTPPFRLPNKNCHFCKDLVLPVRQAHHLCYPFRSANRWPRKLEAGPQFSVGVMVVLTMVGSGGSEAAIIRLE